ncbi:MAG: NTP transferase domain-containing protein [Ramlibacter sp.]
MSADPVVIVLASGRGERFIASGGSGSKLHALLLGKPVLEHTLGAVRASGLAWHLEDAGHAGMGDSIAAAVRATRGASGWLVLPGDLPLVQPATLQAVAHALLQHEAVAPVCAGQRGHPVGFSAACGAELAVLEGNQGAVHVLRAHHAIELIVEDLGCVADVDTVDHLAAAERVLRERAGSA